MGAVGNAPQADLLRSEMAAQRVQIGSAFGGCIAREIDPFASPEGCTFVGCAAVISGQLRLVCRLRRGDRDL